MLAARIHRIAVAGRLRAADHRDVGLAENLYQAVLTQIVTDQPPLADDAAKAAAVACRAAAPELDLTGVERELLVEWLDRAIAAR